MSLRVVRVQLDSGERLVGIRYPEALIELAEKELKDQIATQALFTTNPVSLQIKSLFYKLL